MRPDDRAEMLYEHRGRRITVGDRSYIPVARTWRLGTTRYGLLYTIPHRIEAVDVDGNSDWVRIPDPMGMVKVLAAILLVVSLLRRVKG